MHSEQINEISLALSKAQGEMHSAFFDKVNPHFKSKYASLDAIWEACREPLSKNQLSVVQLPVSEGGFLFLDTILSHSSGQWFKSRVPILTGDKMTIQALGSAMTYMKRYSLSAIVGISSREDDDGEGAEFRIKHSQINGMAMKNNITSEVIPCKDFDKLCEENGIVLDSEKMRYVDHCAKKSNQNKITIINRALREIDKFNKSFSCWASENMAEEYASV